MLLKHAKPKKCLILRRFMERVNELKQLLSVPANIALFSHRNPDGDAIGSTLAMRHYLEQYGHSVHVFFPSEFPEDFAYLPGSSEVLIWDIHTEECKALLPTKTIFFYLDFNGLDRIDKLGEFIRNLPGQRILIDHHLYPEVSTDYVLSKPEASSTCELVYEFIVEHMRDSQRLTPKIGDCIFTGIITDTGSFRHATNSRIYRIAAELVDRGVNDTLIQDLINNNQKERNLRLLGHCLYNRMEYYPEFATALIWLSKKDYEDFEIRRGDTEGIVNYLLTIRDVKLAAFIHNQPNIVKLSLRSKGDFDVQAICKKYFQGGGHKNAAGAFTHSSLKATIQKFKDLLPEYKEALLKK